MSFGFCARRRRRYLVLSASRTRSANETPSRRSSINLAESSSLNRTLNSRIPLDCKYSESLRQIFTLPKSASLCLATRMSGEWLPGGIALMPGMNPNSFSKTLPTFSCNRSHKTAYYYCYCIGVCGRWRGNAGLDYPVPHSRTRRPPRSNCRRRVNFFVARLPARTSLGSFSSQIPPIW